jgi:hypothetical protein
MCSNRENPEPKQLSCSPPDGKYPSEKSSQPAYKAVKPDSRCIGFHVASKRSQPELHKPGRAEGPARNGEVGGSGGNGMEATGGPRSGGPALPCGGCCGGGSGGGGGGGGPSLDLGRNNCNRCAATGGSGAHLAAVVTGGGGRWQVSVSEPCHGPATGGNYV